MAFKNFMHYKAAMKIKIDRLLNIYQEKNNFIFKNSGGKITEIISLAVDYGLFSVRIRTKLVRV
jgi:hypothetical protein